MQKYCVLPNGKRAIRKEMVDLPGDKINLARVVDVFAVVPPFVESLGPTIGIHVD